MIYKYIFLLLLFSSSCAVADQKEDVRGIVDYVLNDGLNKFSHDHLVCFKCQYGYFPSSVSEIVNFIPESKFCKNVFDKSIDFFNPKVRDYKIKIKKWGDRVTILFTEQGINYEELKSYKGHYEAMNISYSEITCTENEIKGLE